jgi:hypothetical protein
MVPAKLLKRVEESSKRKSSSGMDLRDAINRKKLARLSENAKRALQRFAQKELTIFRYSKRPEIFISKNEEHLDWYQQHVGMGLDLESEGHSCTVKTSMAFLACEISFHEKTVIRQCWIRTALNIVLDHPPPCRPLRNMSVTTPIWIRRERPTFV